MFITLTSRYANKPIHVRPEDIAMVRLPDHPVDEEDDGMAEIAVHGMLGAIPVKETPEQIMEMIENQNVYLQQFGRGERIPVPPEGPMLRYQHLIRSK